MKMILAENGGQCNGYSRHTRGRHPFESWEDSKFPLVAAVPARDRRAAEPRRSWCRDSWCGPVGGRRPRGWVKPLRKTARGASSHGNAPVMIAAANSGDANPTG